MNYLKLLLVIMLLITSMMANALTYIKCSCSDVDGAYNRSCYSTTSCSTCCCMGLDPSRGCGSALGSKPASGVGGNKMSSGYEGPTIGTILPGVAPKTIK
jgi:hypothetical protein